MKKMDLCGSLYSFLEYFHEKKLPQITHANHMTMTTIGQTNYRKTKENVSIKLLEMCESLIVYILLRTCKWVHMVLAINRPDIPLM